MFTSPYREALHEDVALRGLSRHTKRCYMKWMERVCDFCGKAADQLTERDVRRFLVDLIERGLSEPTVNQAHTSIRIFFERILKRPEELAGLPMMKKPEKLPQILSETEVELLIDSAGSPRDAMFLIVAYGCGLRCSEIASLRIEDVQGSRLSLRVRAGKGKKDRNLPLSELVLEEFRSYYRACLSWNTNGEKTPWLFPSPHKPQAHIDKSVVRHAFNRAKAKSGLKRVTGIHTLRHCYATHLLELGVGLKTIQYRLGHRYLRTTLRYLHVARVPNRDIPSPYDFLKGRRARASAAPPDKKRGPDCQG